MKLVVTLIGVVVAGCSYSSPPVTNYKVQPATSPSKVGYMPVIADDSLKLVHCLSDTVAASDSNPARFPQYPNPLSAPSMYPEILFHAATADSVSLRIYDAEWMVVRTLLDTVGLEPGCYKIGWSGLDDSSRVVGSGVYFYRLSVADSSVTRKLTFLR